MSDGIPTMPAGSRQCAYPGCTVEVADGAGSTCSPEHKLWFDEEISNSNAGIPSVSIETNHPTPAIGGAMDY